MIKKSEYDLMTGMHQELIKNASGDVPDLLLAAECLHAALEIFEEYGMNKQADQILTLMEKIANAPGSKRTHVQELPSMKTLLEKGFTSKDFKEFTKGNPVAKAKLNLILRGMGLSDHQIAKAIGFSNVMSEDDAKSLIDPNRMLGKFWEWAGNPTAPIQSEEIKPGDVIEFESLGQMRGRKQDPATKGLTPAKEVKNLKEHGHPLNVNKADDVAYQKMLDNIPPKKDHLTKDDVDPEFADLLDSIDFNINASDDDLMGIEVHDDTLEVFDANTDLDFEDEKDIK